MGLFEAIKKPPRPAKPPPFKPPATPADIEAMFLAERDGVALDPLHLFLATPAYNPPELAFLHSRELTVRDLFEHDIKMTTHTSSGDSLVTRGRHCLMYEFLKSPASHLLFWDSDIEVRDPATARNMLATGHDVLGGACPFRDLSKRVVMNLRAEDRARGRIDTDQFGCVEVSEIGTGFMLLSRAAIVLLCALHPERFYRSDLPSMTGKPMWALFDTTVENQRYLSEDYFFCKLWKATGGKVYVYAPAEFRHYGTIGCEGSFVEALNMREVAP